MVKIINVSYIRLNEKMPLRMSNRLVVSLSTAMSTTSGNWKVENLFWFTLSLKVWKAWFWGNKRAWQVLQCRCGHNRPQCSGKYELLAFTLWQNMSGSTKCPLLSLGRQRELWHETKCSSLPGKEIQCNESPTILKKLKYTTLNVLKNKKLNIVHVRIQTGKPSWD